jgi:acetyl-CoA acetyltransferase
MKTEESAIISGIGSSQIGRRLHRDPLLLTADSALAAIADAGLETGDIDGLSTYPGLYGSTPGITGGGINDVRSLLGLDLRWHTGGSEVGGQLGAVVNAVLAVAGGLATHVLCFRTVWESTAQEQAGDRSAIIAKSSASHMQWGRPYGSGYVTHGALLMKRYMYEANATREQIAQIPVVSRANAARNPRAVYRDPMSVDDYLQAPMISDPLCLYDCDVPVDGSIALVVSRANSTSHSQGRAIKFEAVGTSSSWEGSAAVLWSRTALRPSDVNVAQLYDGFSVHVLRWLETLGFTAQNEAARFVEGGQRISLDGELPINTGGGQLSGGRVHGYGGLFEACLQLRGEAEDHQVPGDPEVVVVSSFAGSGATCLLLTR